MTETSTTDHLAPHSGQGRDTGGIRLPWAFIVLVALLAAGRFLLAPYLTAPALQTGATVSRWRPGRGPGQALPA
jgi:hypothetical protein